jgi:hypothetical protein
MGAGADPGEDVQVDPPGVQLILEEYEEFFHRASDPVGFVDHKGVAGLKQIQRGHQLGTLAAGTGCLDNDLAAVGGGERVELGLVVLDPGGDAGVSDADSVVVDVGGGHGSDRLENDPERVGTTRGFGTSFWDGVSGGSGFCREVVPKTTVSRTTGERTSVELVGQPQVGVPIAGVGAGT